MLTVGVVGGAEISRYLFNVRGGVRYVETCRRALTIGCRRGGCERERGGEVV